MPTHQNRGGKILLTLASNLCNLRNLRIILYLLFSVFLTTHNSFKLFHRIERAADFNQFVGFEHVAVF